MPIPKPRKNETEKDFLDRCMGDDVMNKEYPDGSQRSAICHTSWRDKNKTKVMQSLIFNKKYFSRLYIGKDSVSAWMQKNGFSGISFRRTSKSWHIQIRSPEDFCDIGITKKLDTGVKGIMGYLK